MIIIKNLKTGKNLKGYELKKLGNLVYFRKEVNGRVYLLLTPYQKKLISTSTAKEVTTIYNMLTELSILPEFAEELLDFLPVYYRPLEGDWQEFRRQIYYGTKLKIGVNEIDFTPIYKKAYEEAGYDFEAARAEEVVLDLLEERGELNDEEYERKYELANIENEIDEAIYYAYEKQYDDKLCTITLKGDIIPIKEIDKEAVDSPHVLQFFIAHGYIKDSAIAVEIAERLVPQYPMPEIIQALQKFYCHSVEGPDNNIFSFMLKYMEFIPEDMLQIISFDHEMAKDWYKKVVELSYFQYAIKVYRYSTGDIVKVIAKEIIQPIYNKFSKKRKLAISQDLIQTFVKGKWWPIKLIELLVDRREKFIVHEIKAKHLLQLIDLGINVYYKIVDIDVWQAYELDELIRNRVLDKVIFESNVLFSFDFLKKWDPQFSINDLLYIKEYSRSFYNVLVANDIYLTMDNFFYEGPLTDTNRNYEKIQLDLNELSEGLRYKLRGVCAYAIHMHNIHMKNRKEVDNVMVVNLKNLVKILGKDEVMEMVFRGLELYSGEVIKYPNEVEDKIKYIMKYLDMTPDEIWEAYINNFPSKPQKDPFTEGLEVSGWQVVCAGKKKPVLIDAAKVKEIVASNINKLKEEAAAI